MSKWNEIVRKKRKKKVHRIELKGEREIHRYKRKM
jgi:hypothetical protein